MLSEHLFAADYHLDVGRAWGTDPLQDQAVGGGLLWVFGDVVVMFMLIGMFRQWSRSELREQRRVDRHLDRLYGKSATTMKPGGWSRRTRPRAPLMSAVTVGAPLPRNLRITVAFIAELEVIDPKLS